MLQTSILILLFFFSWSTTKSYLLSVNPVLGASVAVNKRFSKFTCDYWFRGQVLTSFIFEKNLSTNAVFRGKMNIRWSSFKQFGKIITQAFYHLSMLIITRVHQKRSLKHEKCLFLSRSRNSLVSFETFLLWLYVFQTYTYQTPGTLQLQLHY